MIMVMMMISKNLNKFNSSKNKICVCQPSLHYGSNNALTMYYGKTLNDRLMIMLMALINLII